VGGERAAEEAGGGSESGQRHAAVGHPKKLPGLVEKRAEVQRLRAEFATSERHVCELLNIPRSTCRHRSCRDDSALRQQLMELADDKPRFGYRRLHILLRRSGQIVNHKRVQRVYRAAGLCVTRLRRRRLTRAGVPLARPTAPNEECALDFVSDVTAAGQRLRVLCVVDAFTRECLALETDTSMPSGRVRRVLDGIIGQRGAPRSLRSDNGPEVSSRHYLWHGVWSGGLQRFTFSQASRCRTVTSRASTAVCAMNVSTPAGSGTCGKRGGGSRHGASNTTNRGRTLR
jgi:hypothetical protein